MGWYKDSFISKAKVVCRSKAKQGIASPLPMAGQVFIHGQENGAPLPFMVTCEDKHHHSKSPPLSFLFLQCYTLSTVLSGMEYPLGELESALYPQPPHWWGSVKRRKGLSWAKSCSEIRKQRQDYQHCSQNKSKIYQMIATMKKISSNPVKTIRNVHSDPVLFRHLEIWRQTKSS